MAEVTLTLPISKSIKARQMLICAINGHIQKPKMWCDDTAVIHKGLAAIDRSIRRNVGIDLNNTKYTTTCVVNVNHSGTALRFLTAYAAARQGAMVQIVGSERLCSRPIHHLVDALRGMGANIEYLERDGYAPLLIYGTTLDHTHVSLPANISSQYFSALMLIAPLLSNTLTIDIVGEIVSSSYINLTAQMMTQCGVEPTISNIQIVVPNGQYCISNQFVCGCAERDWSAATFWLAATAIEPALHFTLPKLYLSSHQPDAKVLSVFEQMGVHCTAQNKTVNVYADKQLPARHTIQFDATNNPDCVPALLVTACMIGIEITITGIQTLRLKESDRAEALVEELGKCGFKVKYNGIDTLHFCPDKKRNNIDNIGSNELSAHNDHRIAMALSLLSLRYNVTIDNPDCVAKSYPDFWQHLAQVKKASKTPQWGETKTLKG